VRASQTAVDFTHTVKRWNMHLPAQSQEHVRPNDVLLQLLPSLANLRGRFSLRCSAGSQVLRRSPTSPARAYPPYGLWPSRTGLDRKNQGVLEISRFSCMLFLAYADSIDYAGSDNHSRITRLSCCLPPTRHGVGILIYRFFEAQSPRPPMPPFYASSDTSRCHL
jgi:hypothetical protein